MFYSILKHEIILFWLLFYEIIIDNFPVTTSRSGKSMQISVHRSQNGGRWGVLYPIGRHFVSDIH